MSKWKEYFCLTPMCESNALISAETLGKICLSLGRDYVVCCDDRGGIGIGKLDVIIAERKDGVQTVCFDCAKAQGFVPKDKVFGVWTGRCDICHETKPCSDLHHDWRKKGESK